MLKSLLKNCEIDRVMVSKAAGQAANVSDEVDMAGFESCLVVATIGAITTTGIATLKASQASTSGGSFADLEDSAVASSADGDADGILLLELINQKERYLKFTLTTSVANVEIDSITVFKFGARKMPITDNADIIAGEQHIHPDEGTA